MCLLCRPIFAAEWEVKAEVVSLSRRLLHDRTTEHSCRTATLEHTVRVATVTQGAPPLSFAQHEYHGHASVLSNMLFLTVTVRLESLRGFQQVLLAIVSRTLF